MISFAPYGFHYYPPLVKVVCGDKEGMSLASNLLLYDTCVGLANPATS